MSVQSQSADVVLHAEHVKVARKRVPVERVRVRREVITEDMTVTVTVRREVLRIEREPLDPALSAVGATGTPGGGHAATGADAGPEVLEVVLSAERPVISLEVVPYERVLLGVRSVATSTPLTVDVRREVADVTTDAAKTTTP